MKKIPMLKEHSGSLEAHRLQKQEVKIGRGWEITTFTPEHVGEVSNTVYFVPFVGYYCHLQALYQ